MHFRLEFSIGHPKTEAYAKLGADTNSAKFLANQHCPFIPYDPRTKFWLLLPL